MSIEQSIINNNNDVIINTNINIDIDKFNLCDKNMDDSNYTRSDNNTSLPNLIYRFKFTEEIMGALYEFSKIHQYDERKDFKEAWVKWSEENKNIIEEETSRLNNLGYNGDIINKMFKSARYYFRKKSNEKKQPKQRRQYINVSRELLKAMDNHIETNIFNKDYQPKTGFIAFCKDNEIILKETLKNIFEQGINDSQLIQEKIKKTYKNRYFILTQIKNE